MHLGWAHGRGQGRHNSGLHCVKISVVHIVAPVFLEAVKKRVCPMMSRMSSDERIADVSAALKVCTVVVRYLVLVCTPLRTAEMCM